jgi:hypothetical protein
MEPLQASFSSFSIFLPAHLKQITGKMGHKYQNSGEYKFLIISSHWLQKQNLGKF